MYETQETNFTTPKATPSPHLVDCSHIFAKEATTNPSREDLQNATPSHRKALCPTAGSSAVDSTPATPVVRPILDALAKASRMGRRSRHTKSRAKSPPLGMLFTLLLCLFLPLIALGDTVCDQDAWFFGLYWVEPTMLSYSIQSMCQTCDLYAIGLSDI